MGKFIFIPSFFYSREIAYLCPMLTTSLVHAPKIPMSYLTRMVEDHGFMGMMEVFLTLKANGQPILTHKQAVATLRGNHVSRYKIKKYLPKLIAAEFIGQSKSATKKRTLYLRGAEWMIEQQGKNAMSKFVCIPTEALGKGAMVFKAHICNLAVKMLATRIYYRKTEALNRGRAKKHFEACKTLLPGLSDRKVRKVIKGKLPYFGKLPDTPVPVPCRVQEEAQVPFSIAALKSIAPKKSMATLQRIRKRACSIEGTSLTAAFEDAPPALTWLHLANNHDWRKTRQEAPHILDYLGHDTIKFARMRWLNGRIQFQEPSVLKFEGLKTFGRRAGKQSALWQAYISEGDRMVVERVNKSRMKARYES